MSRLFKFDVFLSYSSKDRRRVKNLARKLRDAGLEVWFDEWAIVGGDDIYRGIEQGIQRSRTLVLCMSPAAFGSDWVTLERGTSIFRDPTNQHRRFVPLLLADCEIPDVIRRVKHIDWRKPRKEAFAELLAACTPKAPAPTEAAGEGEPEDELGLPIVRERQRTAGKYPEEASEIPHEPKRKAKPSFELRRTRPGNQGDKPPELLGMLINIRLLGSTNDARGDLFTRLVKDLFFALGYDDLCLDVHKAGRELDIQGTHRLEPKRMVAECKAHAEKIGGGELNKFFGALTRERDKHEPTPVVGYFVSLSGFRETAKGQELELREQKRVILIDGKEVIEELQRCRVLVSHTEAAEQAGHCAEHAGLKHAVLDGAELLGHEHGYIWAVYYAHGKARTHFALIHADGTPLAESVAADVIAADRECEGSLHTLRYLAPPAPAPDRAALAKAAVEQYCQWVGEECGYIQLDGLPADTDLAATRMKLERLFVPLRVVVKVKESAKDEEKETGWTGPVGQFMGAHPHVALLASPGGGKSTLLKRLAIAYAVPGRRTEVDDRLPDRDWLPLFIRCRDLRDRAHLPIPGVLDDLSLRAGMTANEAAAFCDIAHEALRSGRALLLVDGLDEISDEGARKAFALHLRTFLAMFPRAAMVVTSREAGFRHVAGVVAGACKQAELAPFGKDDVARLCQYWHIEVVGNTEKVRSDAHELAKTIWENQRIRVLAENPLMLTTLLVVRRWIGELPRRRVDLYREAIRVLIRTWNVEGYEPMDEDETLVQLSYVACTMMAEGRQRIGHKALLNLLQETRRELAAELEFARIGAPEFIERIEYRSSLLMQTGYERIDGELQAVYEFRHLTFQEYLAARGFVEEQYPGRDGRRSLAELLEPRFGDERWREVVPLAAVLAGRKAEDLIKRLTAACEARARRHAYPALEDVSHLHVVLLRQCLLDEVQVMPATLRAALRQAARHGCEEHRKGSVAHLRRGKFGEVFQEVAEEAYFGEGVGWEEHYATIRDLAIESTLPDRRPGFSEEMARSLARSLGSLDRIEQARAAFACGWSAFLNRHRASAQEGLLVARRFHPLRHALGKLLLPDDPPAALAASWAFGWIGEARLPGDRPEPAVLLALYRLWREAESKELAHLAASAFSRQPLLSRDTFNADAWGDCDAWFEQTAAKAHENAPLVLAWYRRTPWSNSELAEKVGRSYGAEGFRPTAREILATLDERGHDILTGWGPPGS